MCVMIDETDRMLLDWLGETQPGIPVTLTPPSLDLTEGINVYLFDVSMQPTLRGNRASELPFSLSYLVTTWFADPLQAHRILSDLLTSALTNPAMELGNVSQVIDWQAFGIPPRPAFVLRLPGQFVGPERTAPPVREPLEVHTVTVRSVAGQVLGPGGRPISDARVTVSGQGQSVTTDNDGRFQLPMGVGAHTITVTSKGQTVTVRSPEVGAGAPLLVHFDPAEV